MDISYLGGRSFVLKDERTVAINPEKRAEKGVITLHSSRKTQKGLIVDGPGEYEIGGVLIITAEIAGALAHAVEIAGQNVVHLDRIPADTDSIALAALGPVDVLLVNADDLGAAQRAIAALTPRVIVPYGTHAVELCKALGVTEPRSGGRWSWTGTNAPPKAVLLKAPGSRRRAA